MSMLKHTRDPAYIKRSHVYVTGLAGKPCMPLQMLYACSVSHNNL